jgi:hypothetical protein
VRAKRRIVQAVDMLLSVGRRGCRSEITLKGPELLLSTTGCVATGVNSMSGSFVRDASFYRSIIPLG